MKHEQDSRFLNAFERLFSPDELDTLGQKTGFMKRRRQVTPHKFCMALVSALGSGTTNSITDIHRQFNHMHFTNIQLKPFHKQLVKMAAPAEGSPQIAPPYYPHSIRSSGVQHH